MYLEIVLHNKGNVYASYRFVRELSSFELRY